jgi:putative ABC transport system ATP-binding protein
MGPSGSGKSTLLYNVSGMDDPDTGEVVLGNTVITDLSEDEKGELRLGKYIQDESREREQKTVRWLESLGW